jgi:hypothetical protein
MIAVKTKTSMSYSQTKTEAASRPLLSSVVSGLLQRKCACGGSGNLSGECKECEAEEVMLQRKAANRQDATSSVPAIVHDVLHSPGHSLDTGTRALMESGFGHDFSRVRVHTDARAAESAGAVNALAYTVGNDVVFAGGQYAPSTNTGRKLLAHELAHTIQQGDSTASPPHTLEVSGSEDTLEEKAEHAAQLFANHQPVSVAAGTGPRLARQKGGEEKEKPEAKAPDSAVGPSATGTQAQAAQAGQSSASASSSVTIPTCTSTAVNQWIKDPKGQEVFGLTTLSGAGGTAPEFKVEPAPSGKRVKVKETSASLQPIEMKFLSVGAYPDSSQTYSRACQKDSAPSCVAGKFPVYWNVTTTGSSKIAEGEQEHCTDYRFAFYLVLGRVAEEVNQLARGGKTFFNEAAAKKELAKTVKLDPSDWVAYFNCLCEEASDVRDRSHWHRPQTPSDANIRIEPLQPGGPMVAKLPISSASLPQIGKHDSGEVVVNKGAPRCNSKFKLLP